MMIAWISHGHIQPPLAPPYQRRGTNANNVSGC